MKLPHMERSGRPLAALVGVLCLSGGHTASASLALRRAADVAELSAAPASFGPVLLDFAKELKSEARAGVQSTEVVAKWCKDACSTKSSMSSVLQRQLDEAGIAMKQVALEEQRLANEARLAGATLGEKRRQLEDATSSAQLAGSEFSGESSRIEKTLSDTSRALRMVEAHQAEQADDSTGEDADADAPAAEELMPTDEVSSAYELTPSQKMVQNLRQMSSKLSQDKGSAASEHSAELQKMTAFADRLNSSLMDADSQVASIRVETSRRKRERARLSARRAGLEALLGVVQGSVQATEAACSEEELHQGELGELVNGEKKAVAGLLRSLPSPDASSSTDSGEEVAPSLLQTSTGVGTSAFRRAAHELRGLAQRFPGGAALLEEGVRRLGGQFTDRVQDAAIAPDAEADSDSAERNPLASIQQFVKEGSTGPSAANDASETQAREQVRKMYSSLIGELREQARDVSKEEGQCASLARDAAVDEAALGRSLKTVIAELHMAKATMSEHQQSADYYQAHHDALASQLSALKAASEQAAQVSQDAGGRLQGFAQRLLNLASSGESTTDEAAKTVQGLVQRVEEHRAVLQQRAQRLAKQANSVGLADDSLMTFLEEEVRHNQRLLKRSRAESELLESRAAAKGDDQKLGQQFRGLVAKLCSTGKLQTLDKKSKELLKLSGELHHLAAGDPKLATAEGQIDDTELAALLK
eukprot:CAMPEP_0177201506 /NCGR_PEP_ID=MMETSP0367-20130122/26787_1 /TAXON_ID=447022 ORGANISM="Scrippsiella hangoei-like, Strain SHHI-4" /NCGR_SAMPLE_ID=MMETSP0367 /ASSEMBLY_ACC=CAM_ASM_000362 /LENGTH=703 /DNA_ID=CAMNT_0018650013 /DNA_START=57 /DNA_END=2168 /DNA_ORIENTATION=-